MISIVLVSHSRKIAEGLMDLLRQVTPPTLQMAQASGSGPDHAGIGPAAVYIAEALQSVYSADGVLVLMDLGSALLSAEMAADLLPEEMRAQVCFCPAPFVEGALAAGVQAGLGSDLQSICRESQQALAAKIAQLSSPAAPPAGAEGAGGESPAAASCERVVLIRNPHGLHLRPAARLVQAAAGFAAEIKVWNLSTHRGPVQAKSINALAMLDVRQGHEIRIAASGPGAEAALQALEELARRNFDENLEEPASPSGAAAPPEIGALPVQEGVPRMLRGMAIAPGVAMAPLYRLQREAMAIEAGCAKSAEAEGERLDHALQQVKSSLQKRRAAIQQQSGEAAAAIFDAHRLLLEDPQVLEPVRRRIFQSGFSAASAWSVEIDRLAKRYAGLSDSYLSRRAADIEDVGRQVIAALGGKTAALSIPSPVPILLYADELSPSETAQLDLSRVAGLVTARGGETSHSAILARAMGLPAVSGIDLSASAIPDGAPLILDGDRGLVFVDPPAEVRADYAARKQKQAAERAARLEDSQAPAVLKSGRRIEVLANIGAPGEARLALTQGAEGVGLLRTEFLFLSRAQAPGEEEQLSALRSVAQAMEGRPVTVRTLDVGGDKDLPYLDLPGEANPFLGVRAIRLALRYPGLFQAQLRALLRAAQEYPLRVMFPMVATVQDLQQALERLAAAQVALAQEGLPHRWPIETGVMIEIPSAALLSDRFAPLVDFFSIGTNDLTQYTLAADRGNAELAEYNDALHPAVLRLVEQVVESAKRHGKRVGVCGELAGDPLAAPVLVGLGVDEFSLAPAAIPRVKETIRALEEEPAKLLAGRALQMDGAASVRREAREYLHWQPGPSP
jgi:phosphocarrier protein FPr